MHRRSRAFHAQTCVFPLCGDKWWMYWKWPRWAELSTCTYITFGNLAKRSSRPRKQRAFAARNRGVYSRYQAAPTFGRGVRAGNSTGYCAFVTRFGAGFILFKDLRFRPDDAFVHRHRELPRNALQPYGEFDRRVGGFPRSGSARFLLQIYSDSLTYRGLALRGRGTAFAIADTRQGLFCAGPPNRSNKSAPELNGAHAHFRIQSSDPF